MDLLVSVRSESEAQLAASLDIDIVDLKEPDHGSLGAVSLAVARSVGNRLGDSHRLSLAFGELIDFDHIALFDRDVLGRYSFAKIGLAGCAAVTGWKRRWLDWAGRLVDLASPVLVAYADHQACNAPKVEEVARLAIEANIDYFLIDTWSKDGRNLFDFLKFEELDRCLHALRDHQIQIALAGSLDKKNVEQLERLSVDVMAVRGAVCKLNDRTDSLCPKMTTDLLNRIKSSSVQSTSRM